MAFHRNKRVPAISVIDVKANALLPALILLMLLIIASCTAQPATPFTNPPGTPYPPVPTFDAAQVTLGRQVYHASCVVCHCANAEGAPSWWSPDASGNCPASPHGGSG